MRMTLTHPLSLLLLTAAASAQEGVDTFGQARAQNLAELGRLPTARDVVVRDVVNYRRHALPLPRAGADAMLDVRFDRAGGMSGDELWLQVGYTTAPQGDRALAPPCAVALVVDCSGSMADTGKLTAVQAGLRAFAERLRPDDEVALVTFATEARVVAHRRARGDGQWLAAAIEELQAGGNTNLLGGLLLGLDELAVLDGAPRDRRVVLLTDGIANCGETDPERILAAASQRTAQGIDLATIGVGQDLDVPLLQRLADGAHGLFHFVAGADDVQKVFVQEACSLLMPIARAVHLTITVPDELEVLQVYDERAEPHGRDLELALPDLNAGATGVVMVRGRLRREAAGLAGRATLRFQSVHAKAPESIETRRLPETDRQRDSARDLPDLEVRTNAAIAVLAQGLAEMARACDARRWADADRALRLATDDAERLFPGRQDDVQRVRELVLGHQRTLQRYLDRFRSN